MYVLNDNWKKIDNLEPLEYYINNERKNTGKILNYAQIVPPFSKDEQSDDSV